MIVLNMLMPTTMLARNRILRVGYTPECRMCLHCTYRVVMEAQENAEDMYGTTRSKWRNVSWVPVATIEEDW